VRIAVAGLFLLAARAGATEPPDVDLDAALEAAHKRLRAVLGKSIAVPEVRVTWRSAGEDKSGTRAWTRRDGDAFAIELVREYATGRVAVVPSFFEGFGFPASEAMACGLPVVANAAGALPEVVGSDGEAGRLVPPRDPRALADALADVLATPEKAERMGRAARARILRTFRWEDAAAGLLGVLQETVRAAHGRSRAA